VYLEPGPRTHRRPATTTEHLAVILVSRAFAALVALSALAPPAFAQADFLKAPKVACAPDSVTRCSAADKCTTRPASAKDKSDLLVIDFAAKKAAVRRAGEAKPFAEIVEEQVSGEERRFTLAQPGNSGERLRATLSKSGKLSLAIGGDGNRAEAVCIVES
jgi:hypothetical protein